MLPEIVAMVMIINVVAVRSRIKAGVAGGEEEEAEADVTALIRIAVTRVLDFEEAEGIDGLPFAVTVGVVVGGNRSSWAWIYRL